MNVYETKECCTGCGLCEAKCPQKAITMQTDDMGFLYPFINEQLCTNCGYCKKICNEAAQNVKEVLDVYALKHKNKCVLDNSTSGGCFTALSDYFLEQNGAVYGCVLNDKLEAVHIRADNPSQRDLMRDSKYVQSDIKSSFKDVLQDLENGKTVLFTGTPCQTSAIYQYCKNSTNIDNLFLCDIVCHGVASPLIWKEHILYLKRKCNRNIKEIKFRSKELGWDSKNKRMIKYITDDNQVMYDDLFYKLYFNFNTVSRPSCRSCKYTRLQRISDFTMADFWGIEKMHESFDYSMGVSVLAVRTNKGRMALDNIKNNVDILKSDEEKCTKYNPRFLSPTVFYDRYNIFWKDYIKHGYKYILRNYINPSIFIRIKNKFKR